jgi:hypothetical protein
MAISPSAKKARVSATPPVSRRMHLVPGAEERKLNRLLAVLPDDELQRWLPQLEVVQMPLGQVLYESGTTEKYVYFPTTAIVSLLYVMKNGDSAEIAVVGNEGIVGIALFMGGDSTPSRAVAGACGWAPISSRRSSNGAMR